MLSVEVCGFARVLPPGTCPVALEPVVALVLVARPVVAVVVAEVPSVAAFVAVASSLGTVK